MNADPKPASAEPFSVIAPPKWFVVVFTVQRLDDGHTFNRDYTVQATTREKAKTAALPRFTDDYPEERFRYLGRIALDYDGEPTFSEHLES